MIKVSDPVITTIFIVVAAMIIYVISPAFSAGDTKWSLYVAMSIIQEGNTGLDEYTHLMSPAGYRLE